MIRIGPLGNFSLVLAQRNIRADLLVVAVCSGKAQAAVYAVAVFAAETVNIAFSKSRPAFPNAVARFAEGDTAHELTDGASAAYLYASCLTGVFVLAT